MFIKCLLCARLLVGPMAMTLNKARLSSVLHMPGGLAMVTFPSEFSELYAQLSVEKADSLDFPT